MLMTVPLSLLETALNQYIRLDPDVKPKLAAFTGKVLAIQFTNIPLKFYLLPSGHGISLMHVFEGEADATLKGSAAAFVRLGLTRSATNKRQLFGEDLEILGDTEFGHELQKILDGIDIDWEELLAKIVGDVLAHQIGDVARGVLAWGDEFRDSMHRNMTEYLQEESRLFPPREEIEDFFHDIATLRDDVERLEARLQRLIAK